MIRKLPHLVFAAAFSGLAALGVASDSDFVADEIRGLHSELADTRRWVDSDIRANLAHRWETIPNRLAERGFGWAESGLESLSWIPNADLAVESDSAGKLAGFSVGGTGLLWTGESAAIGFQPWGRWTDGGENDAASFGVFSRRALGDWAVVGGNVFADYAASAEFGDFARWSAGLDFQSPLGELRGNYYAGLSSTRERVGLDSRVLAYAPSGVDAELRLRWFGGSEWSGFAEYEKWAGQFGDSDLEEVGYGLSFRPAGGGLLAGLQVDAGFRDSADSAGRWDLRLGYSRRLGADDSVRNLGSAFAVRSALVAPVAREQNIFIASVTVRKKPESIGAKARFYPINGNFRINDLRPFIREVTDRCDVVDEITPTLSFAELGQHIHNAAYNDGDFDELCMAIRQRGDINWRGTFNSTPLHRAVSGRAIDNLKLLIAGQADVNLQNNNGYTPLDRVNVLYYRTQMFPERDTLQTIAMILRASGGSCATLTTYPCDINYATLYADESQALYQLYTTVTINSNATGKVYQMRHPALGTMSFHGYLQQNRFPEITIHANGEFHIKPGAALANRFGGFTAWARNDKAPGRILAYYAIHVRNVPHSNLWSSPPIRKVASGHTGFLFTVTLNTPVDLGGFSFEPDGSGIYFTDGQIFSDVQLSGFLWTDIPVRTITSRSRSFVGRYEDPEFKVLLKRRLRGNESVSGQIHAYARPLNYRATTLTMGFTISAVPHFGELRAELETGADATLTILSVPQLAETARFAASGDPEIHVSESGGEVVLRDIPAFSERTAVIQATSPELLGTLALTVRAKLKCELPENLQASLPRETPDYDIEAGEQLNNAAYLNDLVKFCEALNNGANPNQQQRFNFRRASSRTFANQSSYLHESDRFTPIVLMMQHSLDDDTAGGVVDALVESGLDPNYIHFMVNANIHSGSYLHYAVEAGANAIPIAKALIRNGADIENRSVILGETPLIKSVIEARGTKMFDFLLDAGADVNAVIYVKPTVYFFSPVLEERTMRTALHVMNSTYDTYMTRKLIAKGANVNARDIDERTPLHYAVDNGGLERTQILLNHGAKVTVRDNRGWTPLHFAVKEADVDKARALLLANPQVVNVATTENRYHVLIQKPLWGYYYGNSAIQTPCPQSRRTIDAGTTALDLALYVPEMRALLAEYDAEHGVPLTPQDFCEGYSYPGTISISTD